MRGGGVRASVARAVASLRVLIDKLAGAPAAAADSAAELFRARARLASRIGAEAACVCAHAALALGCALCGVARGDASARSASGAASSLASIGATAYCALAAITTIELGLRARAHTRALSASLCGCALGAAGAAALCYPATMAVLTRQPQFWLRLALAAGTALVGAVAHALGRGLAAEEFDALALEAAAAHAEASAPFSPAYGGGRRGFAGERQSAPAAQHAGATLPPRAAAELSDSGRERDDDDDDDDDYDDGDDGGGADGVDDDAEAEAQRSARALEEADGGSAAPRTTRGGGGGGGAGALLLRSASATALSASARFERLVGRGGSDRALERQPLRIDARHVETSESLAYALDGGGRERRASASLSPLSPLSLAGGGAPLLAETRAGARESFPTLPALDAIVVDGMTDPLRRLHAGPASADGGRDERLDLLPRTRAASYPHGLVGAPSPGTDCSDDDGDDDELDIMSRFPAFV
jgi:hypothetical protein